MTHHSSDESADLESSIEIIKKYVPSIQMYHLSYYAPIFDFFEEAKKIEAQKVKSKEIKDQEEAQEEAEERAQKKAQEKAEKRAQEKARKKAEEKEIKTQEKEAKKKEIASKKIELKEIQSTRSKKRRKKSEKIDQAMIIGMEAAYIAFNLFGLFLGIQAITHFDAGSLTNSLTNSVTTACFKLHLELFRCSRWFCCSIQSKGSRRSQYGYCKCL